MFPRLHYYLRFLLGLTRWEMYGIATLGGLIVGFVFVKEVISKREAEAANAMPCFFPPFTRVFLQKEHP